MLTSECAAPIVFELHDVVILDRDCTDALEAYAVLAALAVEPDGHALALLAEPVT